MMLLDYKMIPTDLMEELKVSMGYKLCILAGGPGTRNTHYPGLMKALLPINNRPAISYIINNVPKDIEIVLSVGYKAQQLKNYLSYVYPDRKFVYVEDKVSKPGPGKALLSCKDYLDCPFIFTSADTLIPEDIIHESPTFDWIGVDKSNSIDYACVINNKLERISIPPIFIGLAGIFDFKRFFSKLEKSTSIEVTEGFEKPALFTFNWKDTGSDASYSLLKSSTIVLPKQDQILFIDNNKVIKYFENPDVAEKVYNRAKLLGADITHIDPNMIAYPYIEGKLFNELPSNSDFYTYIVLDKIYSTGNETPANFKDLCQEMYYNKTAERVDKFLAKYPEIDKIRLVNDQLVKPISFYLNNIPWEYINKTAVPSEKFHGDVQPENIIVGEKVEFIDWRDSFAGNISVGDMYYDFAKLWHGCLVSNKFILNNQFSLDIDDYTAKLSISINKHLESVLYTMEKYANYHKLDWDKIKILGALQYISIAPLYEDAKYSNFLFLLGKLLLEKINYELPKLIKLIQN